MDELLLLERDARGRVPSRRCGSPTRVTATSASCCGTSSTTLSRRPGGCSRRRSGEAGSSRRRTPFRRSSRRRRGSRCWRTAPACPVAARARHRRPLPRRCRARPARRSRQSRPSRGGSAMMAGMTSVSTCSVGVLPSVFQIFSSLTTMPLCSDEYLLADDGLVVAGAVGDEAAVAEEHVARRRLARSSRLGSDSPLGRARIRGCRTALPARSHVRAAPRGAPVRRSRRARGQILRRTRARHMVVSSLMLVVQAASVVRAQVHGRSRERLEPISRPARAPACDAVRRRAAPASLALGPSELGHRHAAPASTSDRLGAPRPLVCRPGSTRSRRNERRSTYSSARRARAAPPTTPRCGPTPGPAR